MNWFRLYHEIIDDPKLIQFSDALCWNYIQILSISSRQPKRGTLPKLIEIQIHMRKPAAKVKAILKAFIEAGLIDEDPVTKELTVHGWDERQRKSDDAATRKSQWRHGRRDATETETVPRLSRDMSRDKTAPHARATETETDREKEIPPLPPVSGGERESVEIEPFEAEPSNATPKLTPQAERVMDQCGRRWGGGGVDVAADLLATFDPAVVEYAATATYDSPKFGRKLTPGATAYWRRVCQNHRDGPPAEGPACAPAKPASPIDYVVCPNPNSLYPQPTRGNAHA